MRQKFIDLKSFQNPRHPGNWVKTLLFILTVFLVSRGLLTMVGVASRNYYEVAGDDWYEWQYDNRKWLDIWSVWDSGWYLDIAQNGYSQTLVSDIPKKTVQGQSNIGFFPLYPLTIALLGRLTGNYHTAGIVISNLSLIISAIFLYKLTRLKWSEQIARGSVLFLFLFPTSFILSGIFSESLFLLLSILTFYFAEKQKWLHSGIFGLLLSLTRPTGVLILIPILYLYLKFEKPTFNRNILYLLLIPLGTIIFSVYLYKLTGDPLAYFNSKSINWGTAFSNPFLVIFQLLMSPSSGTIISLFIISEIVLVILNYRKIGLQYWGYTFLLILTSLINGVQSAISLPRMSSAFFPLFIALALQKGTFLQYLTIPILIIIQIFFMALWSNGYLII